MPTVATQELPTLIASFVWLGLLHATWIGLGIAACVAWLFQARGKISHRVRHGILMLSLGLIAVAPGVFVAMQAGVMAGPSEATPLGRAISFVVRDMSNSAMDRGPSVREPERDHASDSSSSSFRMLGALLVHGAVLTHESQDYGLALWGLMVLVGFVTLAFGLEGMRRLRCDSVRAEASVIARVEQLARTLPLRRIPVVRVHPALDQPCLCGIFRPAILLPEPWLSTSRPETLDAVLAHELAHAKRLDPLWNGLQRLLETVLLFHPGVRWLSRSLRREREIAADSLAIQITGDPLALAWALESVARCRVGRRSPRHVGAAFGGEDPALLSRIQELLGMTPTRPRFPLWPFAAFASAIVLALVTASIGFARDDADPSHQEARPGSNEPLHFRVSLEESARQISYEVRFVELEPDTWRGPLKDALKPLPDQGTVGRWIVIGKPLHEQLIKLMKAQSGSRMTIAPKPTAFEAQHLVIWAGKRAADGEVQDGTTVRLSGKVLPNAIRMSVDLSDSTDAIPARAPGKPEEKGALQVNDSYEVPEGSSLVLSLGRRSRLVESRDVASERLIVITPRRIILEAEEAPREGVKAVKPARPMKIKALNMVY